ncbi:MAG: UvrB/UvrC motif-containing protein [Planctomycetota bacterium]
MSNHQKMCESCQENPATVHETAMENNQVTREKHLCDQCAAKQGVIGKMQTNLVAQLLGSLKEKQKGAGKEADVRCPDCGILYSEFRAKARFGCSRDYDVFRKHVLALLEKIHGSTDHVGKRPKGAPKAPPKEVEKPAEKAAKSVTVVKGSEAASTKASQEKQAKEFAGSMKPKTVTEMEKELEKLVKAEDFEKAAKLRDAIRDLKGKKETKE